MRVCMCFVFAYDGGPHMDYVFVVVCIWAVAQKAFHQRPIDFNAFHMDLPV